MTGIAVVGYGYWGPNLVRNFQSLDKTRLEFCCDQDTNRLTAVKQAYPNLKTTTSYQEVLDSNQVDGVVVATPVRTHYALAREALLHGKHVLVEKPLAMTVQECAELCRLAEQQGLVLMVGHTFLYNPAVVKLKEVLRTGALGELRFLYSQRLNLGQVQTDINVLWSLAPHDISIALYLLDQMPLEVSARGVCSLTPGIEDVAFLTLVFPGDVLAQIHVSWLDPGRVRKVTLVGSQRMADYDDTSDKNKIRIYDKRAELASNGSTPHRRRFQLHSGDTQSPEIFWREPLAVECGHFVQCIQEGKRPLSDGANGLQVVQILEAAQRSLKSGGATVLVQDHQTFRAPALQAAFGNGADVIRVPLGSA